MNFCNTSRSSKWVDWSIADLCLISICLRNPNMNRKPEYGCAPHCKQIENAIFAHALKLHQSSLRCKRASTLPVAKIISLALGCTVSDILRSEGVRVRLSIPTGERWNLPLLIPRRTIHYTVGALLSTVNLSKCGRADGSQQCIVSAE